MTTTQQDSTSQTAWFVGATFDNVDHTERFVAEGVWRIKTPTDKDREMVRSMQVGDRIAIKAAYTRKTGLPFDNRGHSVSVMAIKAVGTIRGNSGDGESVEVAWQAFDPPREWYLFTNRQVIWRLHANRRHADALLAFAFNNQPQDIDRFRNKSYWRDRFGDLQPHEQTFPWTKFYEALSDKLLEFRHKRGELLKILQELAGRVDTLGYLAQDTFADDTKGFLKDICPFTVLGMFNRGITDANRIAIAHELARIFAVEVPVPESFEGIPVLNNHNSWLFPREFRRDTDHIDTLWALFAAAMEFAESDDETSREAFAKLYNDAISRRNVAWKLTIGLYWTRPWTFPSLDSRSREYISNKLGLSISQRADKPCTAAEYLALMDSLMAQFEEPAYPVHSFPGLSYAAWKNSEASAADEDMDHDEDDATEIKDMSVVPAYGIDDIVREGCFLAREEVQRMVARLRSKKNVILQGPPGTGKTWLAKRLAYVLIGRKDQSKLRAVQFHPNLLYEDFVRGWRPASSGTLAIQDGIFLQAVAAAANDPQSNHVVVIEEINRGNPAQIFGELLTLLEADKRSPDEAVELCYAEADGTRRSVHLPANLYVIGTMNIADRSLALVDLALRRRFAFVDLEPQFGGAWRDWIVQRLGVDRELSVDMERRIAHLNEQITADPRLGKQFCIGHSYLTPSAPLNGEPTAEWFREVVRTEIAPLLEEYWFDSPKQAQEASAQLLSGWP